MPLVMLKVRISASIISIIGNAEDLPLLMLVAAYSDANVLEIVAID